MDRIELQVGAAEAALVGPNGPLPLPPGASMDAVRGIFTWNPGVAFIGPYDFTFTTTEGTRLVRIVLKAKGSVR